MVFENVEAPLLGSAGQRSMAIPPVEVGSDGTVVLPYGERLKLAGLTLDDARARIADAYAVHTPNPQVVVTRTRGKNPSVILAGTVGMQGVILLEPQAETLIGVIAAAGGSTVAAEDTKVELIRGHDRVEFRLDSLLASTTQDIALARGTGSCCRKTSA